LKTDVSVPTLHSMQKNVEKTFWLFADQDPDPQSSVTDQDQNATDPEHCFKDKEMKAKEYGTW
jgi:hypothetical protein